MVREATLPAGVEDGHLDGPDARAGRRASLRLRGGEDRGRPGAAGVRGTSAGWTEGGRTEKRKGGERGGG